MGPDRVAAGATAVVLAVAGIAVSAAGAEIGIGFLERGLGPALTLFGAGLWVFVRVRDRIRRR